MLVPSMLLVQRLNVQNSLISSAPDAAALESSIGIHSTGTPQKDPKFSHVKGHKTDLVLRLCPKVMREFWTLRCTSTADYWQVYYIIFNSVSFKLTALSTYGVNKSFEGRDLNTVHTKVHRTPMFFALLKHMR